MEAHTIKNMKYFLLLFARLHVQNIPLRQKSRIKLNVCFLLKLNSGDCMVHLRSPFLLLLEKSIVIHFCTPNLSLLPTTENCPSGKGFGKKN